MSKECKRLALIPARSGSKGVPDKNIQQIGGKSILSLAISAAQKTDLFDRIFISTDSPDYAREAAREGVETPWLRPAALASDTALVADTIHHTLEAFTQAGECFDTIALLEPTSPLRLPEDIAAVVAAAEAEGWDAAFTVSTVPAHFHPLKQFHINTYGCARFIMDEASPNVNRQSLSRTFIRNGIAYAVRSVAFMQTGSIHGTRARAIEIDRPVVSIDTGEDFAAAAALMSARAAGKDT